MKMRLKMKQEKVPYGLEIGKKWREHLYLQLQPSLEEKNIILKKNIVKFQG